MASHIQIAWALQSLDGDVIRLLAPGSPLLVSWKVTQQGALSSRSWDLTERGARMLYNKLASQNSRTLDAGLSWLNQVCEDLTEALGCKLWAELREGRYCIYMDWARGLDEQTLWYEGDYRGAANTLIGAVKLRDALRGTAPLGL